MSNTFKFSKKHTETVKGTAILLMLYHHLFGFPEWLTEGIAYIGIPLRVNTLEYVIGNFGHICVSLFAFVTGYGLFFSYQKGSIFKKSLKKGAEFLFSYNLIIFAVIIPLSLLLGKTDLTAKKLILNMFGIEHDLVSFAWYVRFYLAVLITLPFCYSVMNNNAVTTIPVLLFFPPILREILGKIGTSSAFWGQVIYLSMEYLEWLPCVLCGLCFAKYGLFEKLDRAAKRTGKLRPFFMGVLAVCIFYLRAYKYKLLFGNLSPDIVYAPLFIYILCGFLSVLPEFFTKALTYLSGHSMNIWFLHSVFFFRTAELMKYAYLPKLAPLIVVWVILITLPISYALKYVTSFVFDLGCKPRHIRSEKVFRG